MRIKFIGPDNTRQFKSLFFKKGDYLDIEEPELSALLATGEFEKEDEPKKVKNSRKIEE
jgi:hypothetical protein